MRLDAQAAEREAEQAKKEAEARAKQDEAVAKKAEAEAAVAAAAAAKVEAEAAADAATAAATAGKTLDQPIAVRGDLCKSLKPDRVDDAWCTQVCVKVKYSGSENDCTGTIGSTVNSLESMF